MPTGTFLRNTFQTRSGGAKELLRFEPGMKALDIGAGQGKAMIALRRAGFDVYGVEPSETFRAKTLAEMDIPQERLQLASVESVALPESEFDFVTFGAVLEHLQEPGKAINRAMRWLKPGGVLQAEVPSSDWLVARMANVFFRLHGLNYVSNLSPMHAPFHLYEFGLESFRKHAKNGGYEVARYQYHVCSLYHVPKLVQPLLRAFMKVTDTGMQLTVWLRKTT
jgi:ubiquinone/menaquinone biosynthesis C-methylase UbiE